MTELNEAVDWYAEQLLEQLDDDTFYGYKIEEGDGWDLYLLRADGDWLRLPLGIEAASIEDAAGELIDLVDSNSAHLLKCRALEDGLS